MLLTHRKLLQSKAIAIDNDLRGLCVTSGLKVGAVEMVGFEARIKEPVENLPDLAVLVEPLLVVRQGGRRGVWTNAFQISIRRDQPNPRDIKMRGRDDADDALRGAQIMLVRTAKWSWLKAWAIKIAGTAG
jgi:hypothetical protein